MSVRIIITLFIFSILDIFSLPLSAQCENRQLNFESANQDHVLLNAVNLPSSSDWTVELWFRSSSSSNSLSCDNESILTLRNASTNEYLSLSDCNGDLLLDGFGPACGIGGTLSSGIRTQWHHIAVVYQSGSIEVFLDCNSVFSNACTLDAPTSIVLGSFYTLAAGTYFKGDIDELRIYDVARSSLEICSQRKCRIDPTDPSQAQLVGLYTMDQGDPGNDNTSITILEDRNLTGTTINGSLVNLALLATTSNFVCATNPMLYPQEYQIQISNYSRTDSASLICSGDPLHFCVIDTSGAAINPPDGTTALWEYNRGNGWEAAPLAAFNGTCFGIGPGQLNLSCSQNFIGHEIWDFRIAQMIVDDDLDTCVYYTPEATIKICCPLDSTTLTASSNFSNNLFCEGDQISFQVFLNSSYPFLQLPLSAEVTIDWTYSINGVDFPITAVQNSVNFAYAHGPPTPAGSVCFRADVTHCDSTKSMTWETCFNVDPVPICDSIDIMAIQDSVELINSSPKIYEICGGGYAKVNMTGTFSNCTPNWQYSFDRDFTTHFFLGATNSSINTNIVPRSFWTSDTIFYRVCCIPESNPSGCDTCYSNAIGLTTRPRSPLQIQGIDTICADDSTLWTIVNPDTNVQYRWICDGLAVSSDTALTRSTESCCYVEAQDDCGLYRSNQLCLNICEPIARISCPLSPNICPTVGDTINLTACFSESDCGPISTYQWGWDSGTMISTNGCDIRHVPIAAGTTYYVTVTDSYGCVDSTALTITPCP